MLQHDTDMKEQRQRHAVALISDFFFPRLGGVENHIWSLAHELLALGHKVIVVTHAYRGYRGVQFFSNRRLKVYYCPIRPMTDEDALPTFTATFPLIRYILLRERITVVHAHQATSTLANESVVYAAVLGLPAVYTDHSLFGLHDTAGVILNRVLTTTLATVNAVICVSQACRDNLILRAKVPPGRVTVIPNAVQAAQFRPPSSPSLRPSNRLTVAVVSRLAYRKGVDLLIGIIPIICRRHEHVNFLIGGDGPQRLALHEMVEVNRLEDRVKLLGAVPHARVRDDVLQHGQIFLNCSLTESFCIAILEAACVGLTVVSTNVGGIPEVLDAVEDDVRLADPTVPAMVQALDATICEYTPRNGGVGGNSRRGTVKGPWQRHYRLAALYNWSAVAQQTVQVYDSVSGSHSPSSSSSSSLLHRLACYVRVHGNGPTAWVVVILAVTMEMYTRLVAWLQPHDSIDIVRDGDDDKEGNMVEESAFS